MVPFISCTLLKEEPYCQFMLKHGIRNYIRQFMKTLVPSNFTHRLSSRDLFSRLTQFIHSRTNNFRAVKKYSTINISNNKKKKYF